MKILINYATISGNSAMLAQQLMDKLKAGHAEIEFVYKDADECGSEEYGQYELIIFISSTWDDGNINVIATEYLEGLKNVQNKKFALIGLGDSNYPHFCGAVAKTEEKLKGLGAQLMGESFKIDGFIEDAIVEKVYQWAEAIVGGLKSETAPVASEAQVEQVAPAVTPVVTPAVESSTPPVQPVDISTLPVQPDNALNSSAQPIDPPVPAQFETPAPATTPSIVAPPVTPPTSESPASMVTPPTSETPAEV